MDHIHASAPGSAARPGKTSRKTVDEHDGRDKPCSAHEREGDGGSGRTLLLPTIAVAIVYALVAG
jgi:hypothetical protein